MNENFTRLNKNAFNVAPPRYNLIILHKAESIYKLWHDWLKNFPKLSRYTLGIRADNLFVDLLENLFIANYLPREEKLPLVKTIIKKLDLLKFLIRLSWEIKLLDNNKYQIISISLEEIGRLSWSLKNNLEKTPSPKAKTEK